VSERGTESSGAAACISRKNIMLRFMACKLISNVYKLSVKYEKEISCHTVAIVTMDARLMLNVNTGKIPAAVTIATHIHFFLSDSK
jgi:hypothetical protein